MVFQFLKAFAFIFIAEMGDKTQVLAMAFATKYKIRDVVIGIFLGSLLNHAIAILFGVGLRKLLPDNVLAIVVASLFLVFGFWSLKVDKDKETTEKSKQHFPILTVAFAFFLGELGDKTQLTAITLSSESAYPIIVLAGTVSGMIVTGFIGVLLGIRLGKQIPEGIIHLIAATVFFGYGSIKLYTSILNISFVIIVLYISLLFVPFIILSYRSYKKTKRLELTLYKVTANRLRSYYEVLEQSLEDICLGEDVCGVCKDNQCLIGSIRLILNQAKKHQPITTSWHPSTIEKDFVINRVTYGLAMVLDGLDNELDTTTYKALNQIRKSLEKIAFKQQINLYSTFETYKKDISQFDSGVTHLLKKQYSTIKKS